MLEYLRVTFTIEFVISLPFYDVLAMTHYNAEFLSQSELGRFSFKHVGKNVLIHKTAIIANPDKVTIDSNVRIDAYVIISATDSVVIGNNIHIASHCSFMIHTGIYFEDFSGCSHGVRLGRPHHIESITNRPIKFGRHCLIGANTVIMPNADIGEGVVVGALSLVDRPLDSWGIYAGIPARYIRDRRRDLLAMEAEYLSCLNPSGAPDSY